MKTSIIAMFAATCYAALNDVPANNLSFEGRWQHVDGHKPYWEADWSCSSVSFQLFAQSSSTATFKWQGTRTRVQLTITGHDGVMIG
jgi:hypothetical protein